MEKAILPQQQIEDTEMEQYTLSRTGIRPLSFKGEEVAHVQSTAQTADSYYSGETGISRKITVYLTSGGNCVVRYSEYSQWQGSSDLHRAKVCKSADEAEQFFLADCLGLELYAPGQVTPAEELSWEAKVAMASIAKISDKFAWAEEVD